MDKVVYGMMMKMRKYIVSDLCGDREIYDIIMSYLEDVSLLEDVLLVINGNLIHHISSYEMLEDVQERIEGKGNVRIEYLGGNQELKIYQELMAVTPHSKLTQFFGNLNISYQFPESIHHRPFLVAHGEAPKTFESLKIKDNNEEVFNIVGRRFDLMDRNFSTRQFRGALGKNHLNHRNCFLFKGNAPVDNENGFFYHSYEHSMTIDGGCKNYVEGDNSFDHVPLVEIEEGKATIFIFNHKGDIINVFSFDGNLHEISFHDFHEKKLFLNSIRDFQKKLVKELREIK